MNWEAYSPIILAVLPATIAAVAAWYQAKATHMAVNSRMDELLALAKREASAQATLDEKAAECQRKGDEAITKAAASP